jgi:hypothetical protein
LTVFVADANLCICAQLGYGLQRATAAAINIRFIAIYQIVAARGRGTGKDSIDAHAIAGGTRAVARAPLAGRATLA